MIIHISAKCSDMCDISWVVGSRDGYVPEGLQIGGGDYLELSVDTKTGKLIGFVPMEDEEVREILSRPR